LNYRPSKAQPTRAPAFQSTITFYKVHEYQPNLFQDFRTPRNCKLRPKQNSDQNKHLAASQRLVHLPSQNSSTILTFRNARECEISTLSIVTRGTLTTRDSNIHQKPNEL
jgi:hypothetical protein